MVIYLRVKYRAEINMYAYIYIESLYLRDGYINRGIVRRRIMGE